MGIILIALYPNATRILQSANVAALKPFKNAWKKGVLEWQRDSSTKALTKETFTQILKVVNGFRSCVLCLQEMPWKEYKGFQEKGELFPVSEDTKVNF